MPSITKRGDKFRVQVCVNNQRRTKTFKLKAEALTWALRTEKDMLKSPANTGRHSLIEALQKYSEEESIKKRGCRWEQIRLAKFAVCLPFANKLLAEIASYEIAKWRDSLTKSPGTIRREMVLLNSVFSIAIREWGWISENPMSRVTKPPSPRARDRIYTKEEIDQICSFLNGPKACLVKSCFLLSIETAMRSGEMLSLTWSQVDLNQQVIHLHKTKNGDSRDVPLTKRAVEILNSLPKSDDQVFLGLNARSRDFIFRQARKKAGIYDATFHDSRATAITLLSRKVDVLTLARISGHRDLKSLQIYYRESASDIAKRLG